MKMDIIQLTQLADAFNRHLAGRIASSPDPRISPVHFSGGWEGWLQVELAWFLSTKPLIWAREHSWNIAGAVYSSDFFIEGFPVEIKCQSALETADAFLGKVMRDHDKIHRSLQKSIGLQMIYTRPGVPLSWSRLISRSSLGFAEYYYTY